MLCYASKDRKNPMGRREIFIQSSTYFFPTQAIFQFFRNALVSSYPCYKSWRFREGRTESLLFLNEVIMEAFELRVHLYTLTRLHKKERH